MLAFAPHCLHNCLCHDEFLKELSELCNRGKRNLKGSQAEGFVYLFLRRLIRAEGSLGLLRLVSLFARIKKRLYFFVLIKLFAGCPHIFAVSIRQHMSAYVSIIRQHTSAYVSIRQHNPQRTSPRIRDTDISYAYLKRIPRKGIVEGNTRRETGSPTQKLRDGNVKNVRENLGEWRRKGRGSSSNNNSDASSRVEVDVSIID